MRQWPQGSCSTAGKEACGSRTARDDGHNPKNSAACNEPRFPRFRGNHGKRGTERAVFGQEFPRMIRGPRSEKEQHGKSGHYPVVAEIQHGHEPREGSAADIESQIVRLVPHARPNGLHPCA